MKTILLLAAILAAPLSQPILAQNPLSQDAKGQWEMVKGYVTRTAEKIPADLYAFKPSDDVRTVAQLIGHITDAQYAMCGAVSGKKPVGVTGSFEKLATKDELVKALKASNTFCDEAYTAQTDAEATATAKNFGMTKTKLGWLNFNSAHSWEHYGNLTTYMRIKGIVPPSSEKR